MIDTTVGPAFLTEADFVTKLTPTGSVPPDSVTPDELALWVLANRTFLVDTEGGAIYRADGITRAEYLNRQTGYGKILLGRPWGRQRWAQAHRVVWLARNGAIPGMLQINHLNGLRWDNRIANLELVTAGDNARHGHRLPYEFAVGVDINGHDDRPSLAPYAASWTTQGPIRVKARVMP